MNWDDIRIFIAMAEALSLRRAAALLGINHATVSRRLAALEQQQNCLLFERGPGKLRLTQAGQAILSQAKEMQHKAESIQLQLSSLNEQLQGPLRLSMGDGLIHSVMPILAKFKRQHPAILLEVDISNQHASLQKGEADIALRITSEPAEPLVGRRVGQLSATLYAHKDWRSLFPHAKTIHELPRITWSEDFQRIPEASEHELIQGITEVSCRVNSSQSMLTALEHGLGAALMLCCQGDRSDQLVRLSEPVTTEFTTLWILTHVKLRDSRKIHSLMDMLTEELRLHSELAFP